MGTRGFKSLGRKVQRMERDLDRGPKREVRRTMGTVRHNQRSDIIQRDAFATMHLLQSFTRRVTTSPAGHWRYEHKNTAAYASFVEHGTGMKGDGTHPSPAYGPRLIAGLKQWAIAKPGVNVKFMDEWAESAARTISSEGTDEQPFFWPAWRAGKPVLKARVRSKVRSAVRRG